MLEEYFLLVRRISGLSMSVEDYWELDTWTTSKLLRMEEAIIKEEKEEFNKNNKKHDYVEQPEVIVRK